MSNVPNNEHAPSFWARLWRFLVRLFFVVLVGIALGAVLYFTIPALYRQYIRPVQEHGVRLDTVETQQDNYQKWVNEQLADYQKRLNSMEAQRDAEKARIAEVQGETDALKASLDSQAAQIVILLGLQEDFNNLQMELLNSQGDIEDLQSAQVKINADLVDKQAELTNLGTALSDQESNLEQLSEVVYQEDIRWQALQLDMQMIKVMEFLTRARYYLSAGNTGNASADIQSALDILEIIRTEMPGYQVEMIEEITTSLVAAQNSLPRYPVIAADRLEGAWQLVIQMVPTAISSISLQITSEITSTVALTPTTTSAPLLGVTPTPTP